MPNNPKVSICMPNYNYARFLPEAIESALRQTYADFELIIVDNCSTDGSVEIIKKYAKKDPRITLSVNDGNIGLVRNLNLALSHARGEYIKILSSDDSFASDSALERMVAVLDRKKDVVLVASARTVIDEHSNSIRTATGYRQALVCPGTSIIMDCLLEQRNKIGEPSAVLFRKQYGVRGFDEQYGQILDLELWFHILEQGNFAYLEEPLCTFRVHAAQQTQVNLSQGILPDEAFKLLQDYAGKSYITLSRMKREYMMYVPVYAVWKQYRKGFISFPALAGKIKRHYTIARFIFLFPIFKAIKFVNSITRSLKK